ncbi:MAG: hypothetical protein ACXWUG_29300 [Polyangiales bacterium]
MRRALAVVLFTVACSSSSNEPAAPADAGATDAGAEVEDTGHPALSALGATFHPSQLRASSGGLHFLADGAGKDFSGADAPSDGVRLFRTSLDGKTQWTFPTCLSAGSGSIDGLPSGDAIVVGSFSGTCTMGGKTLTSAGDDDGFVARLDATGKPKWIERFGGVGVDLALVARLDPMGNAILAGTTSGVDATSLPIGPDAGELLAKIDGDAKVQWYKQFNGGSYKLATGSKSEIVFLGSLLDGTDFGGGPIPRPTSEALAFVMMATDGSVQWSRVMQFERITGVTPTLPIASDVAIDEGGNVWFAARFGGLRVDFGTGYVAPANPSGLSLLVGKLDSAGKPVFGTIYAGGGEARLATGAGKGFLLSRESSPLSGSVHAYLMALGSDGTLSWRTDIGSSSQPTGIGFDGTSVRAMGTFDQPIDFGVQKLAAPGAFLAAWAP